jgi:DNA polymerase III subunit delta'
VSDDHSRDRFDLVPDAAAETAFLDAWERGRLHHAWLLCGVEGTGKATFAYRAARRLLGAAADPASGPLGARRDDPVSRLISAQSHPDLLVLERLIEGGKTKKSISVDQSRELPEFFSKSPSQAQFRVAIIDAADDLNLTAGAGRAVSGDPCAGAIAGHDPVAVPAVELSDLDARSAGDAGAQPNGRGA